MSLQRIQLLIEEIKDRYTKQNFTWLREFVNREDILGSQFKFYELTFNKAENKVVVPHSLQFQPKDIIQTCISGDAVGRFDLHLTGADPSPQRFDANVLGFVNWNTAVNDPDNVFTKGVTWTQSTGAWGTEPSIISPITGEILFEYGLRTDITSGSATGGQEYFLRTEKNGSIARVAEYQFQISGGTTDQNVLTAHHILSVEKGDNIQLRFDNNTSAQTDLETSSTNQVLRISRTDQPITFHKDLFTNKNFVISTSGPCTVRFFAGQFKQGGL